MRNGVNTKFYKVASHAAPLKEGVPAVTLDTWFLLSVIRCHNIGAPLGI